MTLRDGATISLWQNTTSEYNTTSFVSGKQYDTAIAGGGITGIALALMLQKAGLKCIVFEAHSLGFGTTGGTTAHLNTLLDTPYHTMIRDFGVEKAKLVAAAARSAIDLIRENVGALNIHCGFEEADGYLFSQTDDQTAELQKIHDACLQVGVEASYTPDISVAVPFRKAIRIPRQAKFHPLRYVQVLAAAFENSGGVILENCRVTNNAADETKKGIVNIETTSGTFQANNLVFATHIPPGINMLHLRCPAYRSYAMAVRLEDEAYPAGLSYDMYDPYHYYRTEEIDGQKFLIVGGEDHKTGEEPNSNGSFLKLESHIRSHFNVYEVVHQWSSQFFEAVDGLPYIGHLPGNPKNIYVATGYGGNGMTYSHVAAQVLSAIILQQENPYIDVFTPGRIKPVAGFTEFVKHNADVVKQFVGKWFGREELQEIAAMARGEGKVVRYNDQPIAIYKDETGSLFAVNPICTHMKCSVSWNAAEKSWDCPCHGARYSFGGEVLNGPASRDLEPVELPSLKEEGHEV